MIKIAILIILPILNIYGQTLEKVSLQLQWKDQFQFAGYYIAKEKGYYKDVGLDVELKKHQFGLNTVNDVLEKKSNFSIGRISLLLNRAKGDKIVLLSAIFQSSPLVLASKKSSGINNLKDIKDKKIALNSTDDAPLVFAVLASENISLDKIEQISTTNKIDSLLNDEIDIGSFYTSNQIYILEQMGIELNIFDPSDYGFDFYSDLLFTSEDEIKNHPQRVEKFKEASLKGWRYAFENIEESIDLILRKYNTQNKTKEALLYEANVLKKLAYKNTDQLGKIDKYRIQATHNLYKITGITSNKINSDDFIYTNKSYANLELNTIQKEYLTKKKNIMMCIDPSWMPFESFEKNEHIGMTSDYFKILKNKFNLPIKVIQTDTWSKSLQFAQNRKCDILSLAMETPKRKEYLNFTTPYLKAPLILATKNDVNFISDFKLLKSEKIGIPKGYAFVELLKLKYPNINIIEVKNTRDGLTKVKDGELFGYIGTLASVGYMFQSEFSGELKVTGKFDESWELGIGVRNDDTVLFEILEKAIHKISDDEHRQILNKWVAIKYEKKADYTFVWWILCIVLIVIILISYRQIILKKVNKNLQKIIDEKTKELLVLNHNLEKEVTNRTKRLNDFIEVSSDFVWEVDANGVYTYASEGVRTILGYEVDEIIGKQPFDFMVTENIQEIIEKFEKISKNRQNIDSLENWNIAKDGKRVCLLTNAIPIFDENNTFIGYRGTDKDITKNKQQEQILYEQSKLASMGEMIGNIAHQWRQPLSVISTGATGLKISKEYNMLEDKDFFNTCDLINENAQYLSKTIDDFKNFIKGDRKKDTFNLNENINSFLHLLEGNIKNNNIHIIKDIDETISIYGYQNELIQCFINICNNSIDVLKDIDHNRYIFISTYVENNDTIIIIKDNGGGIAKDILPKIFQPYFTTKHKSQGTGLGLHMAYNLIVDGMNGTINAQNAHYTFEKEECIGAKFTIKLPMS